MNKGLVAVALVLLFCVGFALTARYQAREQRVDQMAHRYSNDQLLVAYANCRMDGELNTGPACDEIAEAYRVRKGR